MRDKEAFNSLCEDEESIVGSNIGIINEKACMKSNEGCGAEDDQVETRVGFERNGPKDLGRYPSEPVSFDKACSLVKNSWPKFKNIKKVKELKESGEKVVMRPSFYNYIGPRKMVHDCHKPDSKLSTSSTGDSISNGEFSYNISLTDLEVLHCNNRILKNHNSSVSRNV